MPESTNKDALAEIRTCEGLTFRGSWRRDETGKWLVVELPTLEEQARFNNLHKKGKWDRKGPQPIPLRETVITV